MPNSKKNYHIDRTEIALIAAVFIVGTIFAMYTNHAWEDWFITYRASKNLANGNGFVYTPGEKVHSFTSPLGTLIPAAINYLTFNKSDEAVLWIYRVISLTFLSLAAILLKKHAISTYEHTAPIYITLCMFVFDGKIIDFSINGMETAFMMFFLSLMLYVSFVKTEKYTTVLGISFAGLMWTRPDSFIYISSFLLSLLLFIKANPYTSSRRELALMLLKAGLISSILYFPWFIFAWVYYGSPIPHTIIAKGLSIKEPLSNMITNFLRFPIDIFINTTAINDVFMPSYHFVGGWPLISRFIAKYLALFGAIYWIFPLGGAQGRAASLTMFIACFYLTAVQIRAPWYFPSISILGIFVIGQIFHQLTNLSKMKYNNKKFEVITNCFIYTIAAITVLFTTLTTVASAYQIKLEQQINEDQCRKLIGLWLKENSESPKDTVFLEPLGYIGFYSQLKMYDWPGLSSPEVVAARKKIGSDDFAELILELKPKWLVLHKNESNEINFTHPRLLSRNYEAMKTFDVSDRVVNLGYVPGKPLLHSYQTYTIYKIRNSNSAGSAHPSPSLTQ